MRGLISATVLSVLALGKDAISCHSLVSLTQVNPNGDCVAACERGDFEEVRGICKEDEPIFFQGVVAPSASSCFIPYEVAADKRAQLKPLPIDFATAATCQTACQQDSDCVAFEFDYDTFACFGVTDLADLQSCPAQQGQDCAFVLDCGLPACGCTPSCLVKSQTAVLGPKLCGKLH